MADQMQEKANKLTDYYANLQQKIFYKIIDYTKNDISSLNVNNSLEWRVKMLSKIGSLTDETIKMLANTSGESKEYIYGIVKNDGLKVATKINKQLSSMLKTNKPISAEINALLDSYARQTYSDIDNNVNQSLLTKNYSHNSAAKTYQDIINKTSLEVMTGLKTPQRALADNIYKWRDNGIKSKLTTSNGYQWSLEGYARTVINTTVGRTYNDVTVQTMKDYETGLAVMSSHAAARKMCAPIQGKVVNTVPRGNKLYNSKYPTVYDYEYHEPAGCFGINCAHRLYPYVEGVSNNFQKQYDPETATKNAEIQQKQRYYERSIRSLKYDLDLASKLDDDVGQSKIKTQISSYQSKLRQIVNDNDFLTRQYDRESISN